MLGKGKEMSKSQYSCHVMQKVIECCGGNPETDLLLKEIKPHIIELTKNTCGNYVVQSIIQNGSKRDQEFILQLFKKDLQGLSADKYASNVIETFIRNSRTYLKEIVAEYLKD